MCSNVLHVAAYVNLHGHANGPALGATGCLHVSRYLLSHRCHVNQRLNIWRSVMALLYYRLLPCGLVSHMSRWHTYTACVIYFRSLMALLSCWVDSKVGMLVFPCACMIECARKSSDAGLTLVYELSPTLPV